VVLTDTVVVVVVLYVCDVVLVSVVVTVVVEPVIVTLVVVVVVADVVVAVVDVIISQQTSLSAAVHAVSPHDKEAEPAFITIPLGHAWVLQAAQGGKAISYFIVNLYSRA